MHLNFQATLCEKSGDLEAVNEVASSRTAVISGFLEGASFFHHELVAGGVEGS